MRERAALFGGKLEAGPHAAGFRVRVTLPVEEFEDAR
jgi:signal transduction histidine kinase